MSELKWVDSGHQSNDYRQGTKVSVFEHKGGYIVETVCCAMWFVTRSLHDKYGRQYETNLFHRDEHADQIREEEVFPDLQSAQDYISAEKLAPVRKGVGLVRQEKTHISKRCEDCIIGYWRFENETCI